MNAKKTNQQTFQNKKKSQKQEKARVSAVLRNPRVVKSVKEVPKGPKSERGLSLRSEEEHGPAKVNQVPHLSAEKVDRDVQRIEKLFNPYYETLRNPSRVVGVRIPDAGAVDTCTFSQVLRFSLTVTAGGVAGFVLGRIGSIPCGLNPLDIASGAGSQPTNTYVLGFQNHTGATDSQLFSDNNTTGSQTLTWPNWAASVNTIPTLFDQARLVSLGVSAISTAASTSLSGYYQIASLPKGYLQTYLLNSLSTNLVGTFNGCLQVPLNEGKGVSATYSPTDSTCLDFAPTTEATNTDFDLQRADPGGIIFSVSGATAGTSIIVTMIGNYEAIPSTQSLSFFNAGSSPNDPIALAEAFNMREKDDLVKKGTSGIDSLSPNGETSSLSPLLSKFPGLCSAPHGGYHLVSRPTRVKVRSRKEPEEFEQKSVFDQVMGMLIPVVKEVAPALLSML